MQNPMVKKAIALTYCQPEMSIVQVKCQQNTLQKQRNYSYTGKRAINYTIIVNKHNILTTVVCGTFAIKANYWYYKT